MPPRRLSVSDHLRTHWFLLAILFCILLAVLNPYVGSTGGPLQPEYVVRYGAVSLIFLLSGVGLSSSSFHAAASHARLHVYVQLFTFVLIPLLLRGFTLALRPLHINSWILRGLVTAGCMPPPVSSAVILTRAAGGNEAAAIFNSVLGSLLGVLATPVILLITLGTTTVVPLTQSLLQLCVTVVFPLLVGRGLAGLGGALPRGPPGARALLGQLALLLIIYNTFCDAFHEHDMALSAMDVLITVILVVLVQGCVSALSFWMSSRLFSPHDTVAAVFCSTHKSLTLGIPILRIMYHGLSHASQTGLPLLVYHPCQLLLGSLLAPLLARWQYQHHRLPH